MTEGADTTPSIEKILIVGGGTAGWMAAAYLSRLLGPSFTIELVESEEVGIVGVGEATIPPIREFLKLAGVEEADFLRRTDATYKVGIEFKDWGVLGDRYLHAFGHVAQELDAVVPLHHWWLLGRGAQAADYPQWQHMFLGRVAADEGRFAIDPRPGSDLGRLLPHAYHFDAVSFSGLLRELALQRGVNRIEGRITDWKRDVSTGDLAELVLEDGRRLKADFFIDCSGFRSLLLGGAMEEGFEDWSHWLPCDRAWVAQSVLDDGGLPPFTRASAQEAGWQWRIPLRSRMGNGYVFPSAFIEEDAARHRFCDNLTGGQLTEPRLLKFRTGRRNRMWSRNVLGLGLSAGFLEPLESTSIHLVQSSLERFVKLFPHSKSDPRLADRFNRQAALEWEQVRDFIIAHYTMTQRSDSEFWRHCSTMELPESLSEILDLWKTHGTVAIDGGHLFQLTSWTSLLIGQNLLPDLPHPLTGRVEAGAIAPRIEHLAKSLRQSGSRLPKHQQFVEQVISKASGT